MSKGTRFLTLAVPLLLLYILALYHIVPTPLLPTELADDILPVVSHILLGTLMLVADQLPFLSAFA